MREAGASTRSSQLASGQQWKAAITVTAASVAAAVYSYDSSTTYVLSLVGTFGETLCSAPAQSVAVALLGLCLFPSARATLWGTGATSSKKMSGVGPSSGAGVKASAKPRTVSLIHLPKRTLSPTRKLSSSGCSRLSIASGDHAAAAASSVGSCFGITSPAAAPASPPGALDDTASSAAIEPQQQQPQQQELEPMPSPIKLVREPSGFAPLELPLPGTPCGVGPALLTCSSASSVSSSAASSRCGSPQFGGSSSGARRRRSSLGISIPRVAIQLSPLPRLSLEFGHGQQQQDAQEQQQQQQRWHPGMPRIQSGHDLPALALEELGARFLAASSAAAGTLSGGPDPLPTPTLVHGARRPRHFSAPGDLRTLPEGQREPLLLQPLALARAQAQLRAAGVDPVDGEATASLGLDSLPPGAAAAVVEGAVSDTHLMQFGAMLGEGSSRAVLAAREAGGPVGHPDAMYGSPDTDGFYHGWEPVVAEAAAGLRYWAWRRPLRAGLYMYMTRSVFEGATPQQLRDFSLDDANRLGWDDSMIALAPVHAAAAAAASNGKGGGASGVSSAQQQQQQQQQSASGLMHARVRFPKPLAPREYLYARRVWPRASDGGCYILARSVAAGDATAGGVAAPPLTGRGVAVTDYASGCVVRAPAAHLLTGPGPAAEVLMIYFENSQMRPGLVNMGVRKGLWPMVQRTDKALRAYQAAGGAPIARGVRDDSRAAVEVGDTRPAVPAACSGASRAGPFSAVARAFESASSAAARGALSAASAAVSAGAGCMAVGQACLSTLLLTMSWLRRVQRRAVALVPCSEVRMARWALGSLAPGAWRSRQFPMAQRLQRTLLRVDSHPLSADDFQSDSPTHGLQSPLRRGQRQPQPDHPWSHTAPSAQHASSGGDSTSSVSSSMSYSAFAAWQQASAERQTLGDDWPAASFQAASYAWDCSGALREGITRCGSIDSSIYPSSSCGGDVQEEGGAGGEQRAGRRQRRRRPLHRLVKRLMQAGALRLAHKLLTAMDADARESLF